MGKAKQKYIHNLAKTVAGQVGIRLQDYCSHDTHVHEGLFPSVLWEMYRIDLMAALRKMGAPALGRIAACGHMPGSVDYGCSFYDVEQCKRLTASDQNSDEILTYLAAYVVVAAMVDVIRAQVRFTKN